MTAILVDLADLRVWTREPIVSDEDIAFATVIIDAVSLRVSEELAHGTYLEDPLDPKTKSARAVALQVARRTYLNPDQETRTAAIGPIGGVSYLDDFAQGLSLTESELERLGRILDSAGGSAPGSGIGVLRIVRDDPFVGRQDVVLRDSYGSGVIYAGEEDSWAFLPPEPDPEPTPDPEPEPEPEPEPLERVTFTVASTSFQPQVRLRGGSTAVLTWRDGTILNYGIAPTLAAPSAAPRIVTLECDTPEDVISINLGHNHAADAGPESLSSLFNWAPQNVLAVDNLQAFPALVHFLASGTPLAGHLDLTGMAALTHVDCYHADVEQVTLTGCTSLVRLVMEQTALTELDLNPVAGTLRDLRGAEQQGGSLTLTPLTAPLAELSHFCVRSQALTGLPTPAQLPAVQQLWVWRCSLDLDELVVRSSAPLDSVRPARDAHPGTVNLVRRLDLAGQTWASAFPGEPEQRIDAWAVGMQTIDLTGMGPVDAIRLQDNLLDTAAVDHVLAVADGWGTSGGTLLLAGNAGPTTLDAVDSLRSRGWVVDVEAAVGEGGGGDPEPPAGALWSDDFERADTTGYANIGGWRQPVGLGSASTSVSDLAIEGGDLVWSTSIEGYHYVTCQPEGVELPADVLVEADFEIGDDFDASIGYFGLCLRVNADGTDGIKCMIAGLTDRPRNGTLTTSSSSVGLMTQALTAAWATPGLHTLGLRITGSLLELEIDGDVVATRTDAAYSGFTGTGIGICGEPRGRHWRAIRVYAA